MRLFFNKELLIFLVVSGSFCCISKCKGENESPTISTGKNDPPNVDIIANNQQELNEETFGEVMKGFGEYLAGNMNEEMDELLKEVESASSDKSDEKRSAENSRNSRNSNKQQAGRIDLNELEKFRDIQHNIAKDTKIRIELVGQKNDGQFTQSWLSSGVGQSSFLTNVNEHLQSAGALISNQMSSLSNLVPKINGKIKTIPSKLRPLFRWPSFLRFKVRFNKVYKSSREELYRQMVYLNRQVVCGIQNVKYLFGRRSHLLRATEFSDMTGREYQEIYDNEEAERESSSIDDDRRLDENTKEKLKELAKENKNIFGKTMEEVIDKTISKNLSLRQKVLKELEEENKASSFLDRKKRSNDGDADGDTEMIDAHHNELDDEEDGEYNEGELSDLEDDDMNEGKSEFFVDEFAAEYFENADKSQANELEEIMDEALGDANERFDDDFKPIDLRQTNCIITPENQDKCGCCYAHVTTAAASYFNCMQFGLEKAQRYNARFTSDCGRYLTPDGVRPRLDGCSGGKISEAIKFTKLVGTHLFMEYEIARVSFDFKSDKCAFPRPEKLDDWGSIQVPFFANTIFTNLRLSEVDLHLRTVGPVLVNLRTWKDFAFQGKGIYGKFEESENPTIHSMLVVGHDRDVHGRDYYIIWNSHGTAWGEQGHVRIYSESLEFFKVYLGGLLTTEAMNQIKSESVAKS